MAKMAVQTQYHCGLAYICLISLHVMIANFVLIEAQVLTADELLAQKEEELSEFVRAVEANANDCVKLKGCSSSSDGCSRLACYEYGNPDHSNYKCLGVANNADCGSQCKERNFDFSKGFVRRVDTVNENIAQTVCTQRTLDDHFRKSTISNSSHLFRVYFGSVDGTTRLYPGLDEKCDDVYDPRLRPWYLESTSVPKAVTVLIDSGYEMRRSLPAGDQKETNIGKAMNMTLKFLETLRESEDFVKITCFDGSKTTPLNNVLTLYNGSQLYQPINDSLARVISNGATTSPNAVDTGKAINEAISQLNKLTNSETHLKVIIVLTSGQQFEGLSELNIDSANSSVNMFVYNFMTPNRMAECDQTIRASSEQIAIERFDNPLYALQSYYSFLAKTHVKAFMPSETQIDYGQQYEDYSGVDKSTLTLSKAAFGNSGELLGVVGLDFFEKKVEEQYKPMQFQSIVYAARKHRNSQYQPNLIGSVCFNHTNTCPGYTYEQGFLCEAKTGDKSIGCCGKCKPKKTELVPILGGVAGGVVGLLAIAAVVLCTKPCIARRLEQKKILAESPKFIFTGPENEAVDQGDSTLGSFGRRALPG